MHVSDDVILPFAYRDVQCIVRPPVPVSDVAKPRDPHLGVPFRTELNFLHIYGANHVLWDVNNKKYRSFPIKTAFLVRAQEIKLKIL